MNGSVAAEQTPHLSHRDVHSFEIESFNPQLRKEEEREGGFRVEWAEDGKRKDVVGKRETDRVGWPRHEEKLSQVHQKGFMYILIHN